MTGPGRLYRDRDGDFWTTRADHLLMMFGGGVPQRHADVEVNFGPLVEVTEAQMRAMVPRSRLALECAGDGGKCWCGEHR